MKHKIFKPTPKQMFLSNLPANLLITITKALPKNKFSYLLKEITREKDFTKTAELVRNIKYSHTAKIKFLTYVEHIKRNTN